jgi:hypothetical protein
VKSYSYALEAQIERLSRSTYSRGIRLFKRFDNQVFRNILVAFSLTLLLAASIFACANITKIQSVTSDQFIGTFIYTDSGKGAPMVASDHTNVLKAPVLWLEGKLPYNITTLIVFNTAFVYISFIVWLYLLSRLLGTKVIPVGALAFAAIIINSTSFAVNIAENTIRHIEYPIALAFIFGLSKLQHLARGYLLFSTSLSLLLALLILNDRFFLFTLVPAGFFCGLIFVAEKKLNSRAALCIAYVLLAGTIIGILLPKIITASGLASMNPGYNNQIKNFVSFESIPSAIFLALGQTIDLFGGLFFGQTIRLANIGLVLCSALFLFAVLGILASKKSKDLRDFRLRFVLRYLALIILFVYLAYVLPGLTNSINARYLTFLVYIGVAFIAFLSHLTYMKSRLGYLFICTTLVGLAIIGIPRTHRSYALSESDSSNNRMQPILDISHELVGEGVHNIVTTGGYQAVRYWSHNQIFSVAEVYGDCKTPIIWANNGSWLESSRAARSAFLVDVAGPYPTSSLCTRKAAESVYGRAQKTIKLDASLYNAHDDSRPAYLLIYDYDIRSRLAQPK